MTPSQPYAVEIESLTRRFGQTAALDGVSLAVRKGEFFSLLGPSGCGKTTLLRLIAGLDIPDTGRLRIGGTDMHSIPAHRRPVNTVFQSYALFPHLSVWDNVAFGLRMKKVPRKEVQERVHRIMAMMEIETLAQRRPAQLSGGQKQRVALARAVVNEPEVLLLDEPLGALDLKLRKQLQLELLHLQRRLGLTFIYVTHDQEEALVLSDRLAVMREGRFEQVGEAPVLYEHPRTRFVSQFLGSCSLLLAQWKEAVPGGMLVKTALGEMRVEAMPPKRHEFTLAIRPEKIQLLTGESARSENCVPVRIEQLIYAGSETHYELRAGAQVLRAEIMNRTRSQALAIGQEVVVHLPASALVVLDD